MNILTILTLALTLTLCEVTTIAYPLRSTFSFSSHVSDTTVIPWKIPTMRRSIKSIEQIEAPNGVRLESITHAYDDVYYTADMYTGDVYKFILSNRSFDLMIKAPQGAGCLGVNYANGKIFVAGAGIPHISGQFPALYVYDELSTSLITSCRTPIGGLINDVTIKHNFAYWTDSYFNVLYKMNLNSLPNCQLDYITLPYMEFTIGQDGRDKSNGIVYFDQGVIIANTVLETLFYVDFTLNNQVTQLLPYHTVTHADGMQLIPIDLFTSMLFIAEPRDQMVSSWIVFQDKSRIPQVFQYDKYISNGFDNPTSPAVFKDTLITTNIDFTVPFTEKSSKPFHLTYFKFDADLTEI